MGTKTVFKLTLLILASSVIVSCNPFYPSFDQNNQTPDPQSDFYGTWYVDNGSSVDFIFISLGSINFERRYGSGDITLQVNTISKWAPYYYAEASYHFQGFNPDGYKISPSDGSTAFYVFISGDKKSVVAGKGALPDNSAQPYQKIN